ncbi:NAD(+) diphosphatase [Roseovarius sp. LXJ103]|uniref:NAD(+) diphosphatase n=1 Tax=Roseovarius carneus TaxID=2853164 RepID=UPI000D61C0E7|nr:NAD(+) diphosphatase [Roseovarius carneus]MBZ8117364.1 NAD(+) diphosphatase [Roseovarius carneus]PWE36818.1 NAD(+) diphosphatase [Pelagicola sp. LXJ1103]
MKLAETVTFGGSALDRAAELRGTVHPKGGQAIAFWRGKPLVTADLSAVLRLPIDHRVFEDAPGAPILLGRDEEGTLIYARELSLWAPEGVDEVALAQFADPTEQVHPAAPDAVFAELRRVMVVLTPRDAELAATGRALFAWHSIHGFCARCGAASDIAMDGWQRTCPACGGHHFPRTDPVVIMLITRGNSVLMGRSPGWPDRMYSLLAGFVEPGETMEAAVRREVFEEAGIRVGAVTYLASQPWPFPASLMLGCAGQALSDEITIDPAEIEAAMWVTREEILDAFAGQNPEIAPAREGAIAHFLLRNWLAGTLD